MAELHLTLSFEELCTTFRLSDEVVLELVELHLLFPQGKSQEEWRFDENNLRRAKIAANLHRDLEINTQGIALAIELLEKIERLESELTLLQKFIK
jgi:chaperone modulatory protein CbpM